MQEDEMVKREAQSGVVAVNHLTLTDCMEQLQEGYVASVAATAGCLYNPIRRDVYGFDALIVHKRSAHLQELAIYVQLKCTTTVKPDANKDHFSFQLKKREYFERLAVQRTDPKAILIVMATSPDQATWTSGDHDSMSTLHACYWVSLEGLEVPQVAKPTVHVPVKNRFDALGLSSILQILEQGGDLREGI